jgi:hypothetical protein
MGRPSASVLASLFQSKPISDGPVRPSESIHNIENIQREQVFMTKCELREFTRKCAEDKVRYELQIEKLGEQLRHKNQLI